MTDENVEAAGPERIWLHGYGSHHGEITWCDDPNPSGEPEEAETAVEYVRADVAHTAPNAAAVQGLVEALMKIAALGICGITLDTKEASDWEAYYGSLVGRSRLIASEAVAAYRTATGKDAA